MLFHLQLWTPCLPKLIYLSRRLASRSHRRRLKRKLKIQQLVVAKKKCRRAWTLRVQQWHRLQLGITRQLKVQRRISELQNALGVWYNWEFVKLKMELFKDIV